MNRDQKAAAIAEIADHIRESQAVFAVDYKGISVSQAAELRSKLRESDATFKIVKNSLTERAADDAEADALKALLQGPTALTFVRGDIATAAKALADYGRSTQLLPFKGGLMEGAALDSDEIRSISRLPSREALYGQLVGVVASPVSGLVRTLGALVSGLAVALGQVQEKKRSGEIPAGEPPATATPTAEESAAGEESTEEPAGEPASARESTEEPAGEPASARESAEEPAGEPAFAGESTEEPTSEEEPAEETVSTEEPAAEAATTVEEPPAAAEPDAQAEPEQDEPAQEDDKQADVSAVAQSENAETNPTKED